MSSERAALIDIFARLTRPVSPQHTGLWHCKDTQLPGVERSSVVPPLVLQAGGKMPSDARKEM